jgi:hypothetical protein
VALEVPDRTVYFVVRAGEVVAVPREDVEELPPDRSRFVNVLSAESLERIRRVVECARSLEGPLPTRELVGWAGATADEKGALAALRVLDLEEIVHAVSGRGKQLVWHPGARTEDAPVPKGVERMKWVYVRHQLQKIAPGWVATDFLVRLLDPEVEPDWADDGGLRHESSRVPKTMRGLPVSFFGDYGKSTRKYVLGALKAWFWLERVGWRHYTSQAVEWCWIAPVSLPARAPRRPLPPRTRPAPYVLGSPEVDRMLEYQKAYQRWVDTHHPEEARKYRDRQRVRELQRQREAKERERARRQAGG